MWAFGCFAFELAQGYPPFHDRSADLDTLCTAIVHDPVPRVPDRWPQEFADFCDKCLKKDPAERWSMEQLLNHSFLVGAEMCREAWSAEYESWKAENRR